MDYLEEVPLAPRSPDIFREIIGEERFSELVSTIERSRKALDDRVIWNVNSTAAGGGVAEMLHSMLAYSRGAGIDVRWMVAKASPEFYVLTKRLHNILHGDEGDGGTLGKKERKVYEKALEHCSAELAGLIRPGDIVILHDPQVAGMISDLVGTGAIVIWRCHIGYDVGTDITQLGWDFLAPYITDAHGFVFSRPEYIPKEIDRNLVEIIPPSIDVFSPKNQDMDDSMVQSILSNAGIISKCGGEEAPMFNRMDGTPSRISRFADMLQLGPPPEPDTPLVVQVSRWDRLKDPIGVARGFTDFVPPGVDAHMVLAGPTVHSVADDPEGAEVLDEVEMFWRKLPHAQRTRIDLACLPMEDMEENAAIVNALQRHATIVVQKSIKEGFGLTVTEAMWKERPVVASAVGGMQDQIEDGVSGMLVADATDLESYGEIVSKLLQDRPLGQRLGTAAKKRVSDHYLATGNLIRHAQLITKLVSG